jgi:hypothetical protein
MCMHWRHIIQTYPLLPTSLTALGGILDGSYKLRTHEFCCKGHTRQLGRELFPAAWNYTADEEEIQFSELLLTHLAAAGSAAGTLRTLAIDAPFFDPQQVCF